MSNADWFDSIASGNMHIMQIPASGALHGNPPGLSTLTLDEVMIFYVPQMAAKILDVSVAGTLIFTDANGNPSNACVPNNTDYPPWLGRHGWVLKFDLFRNGDNSVTSMAWYPQTIKALISGFHNPGDLVCLSTGDDMHPAFLDYSNRPFFGPVGTAASSYAQTFNWKPLNGVLCSGQPLFPNAMGGLRFQFTLANPVNTMMTTGAAGSINPFDLSVVQNLSGIYTKIINPRLIITYVHTNAAPQNTSFKFTDIIVEKFLMNASPFFILGYDNIALELRSTMFFMENVAWQQNQQIGMLSTSAFAFWSQYMYFNNVPQIFMEATATYTNAFQESDFLPNAFLRACRYSDKRRNAYNAIMHGAFQYFDHDPNGPGLSLTQTNVQYNITLMNPPASAAFPSDAPAVNAYLFNAPVGGNYYTNSANTHVILQGKYVGYQTTGPDARVCMHSLVSRTLFMNPDAQVLQNAVAVPTALPAVFKTNFAGGESPIAKIVTFAVQGDIQYDAPTNRVKYRFKMPKTGGCFSGESVMEYSPVPAEGGTILNFTALVAGSMTGNVTTGTATVNGSAVTFTNTNQKGLLAYGRVGNSSIGQASDVSQVDYIAPGGVRVERRYVQEFAALAQTLTDTAKTDRAFQWLDGVSNHWAAQNCYDGYYVSGQPNVYENAAFPISKSTFVPAFQSALITTNNLMGQTYQSAVYSDLPVGYAHRKQVVISRFDGLLGGLSGLPSIEQETFLEFYFDQRAITKSIVNGNLFNSPNQEIYKAKASGAVSMTQGIMAGIGAGPAYQQNAFHMTSQQLLAIADPNNSSMYTNQPYYMAGLVVTPPVIYFDVQYPLPEAMSALEASFATEGFELDFMDAYVYNFPMQTGNFVATASTNVPGNPGATVANPALPDQLTVPQFIQVQNVNATGIVIWNRAIAATRDDMAIVTPISPAQNTIGGVNYGPPAGVVWPDSAVAFPTAAIGTGLTPIYYHANMTTVSYINIKHGINHSIPVGLVPGSGRNTAVCNTMQFDVLADNNRLSAFMWGGQIENQVATPLIFEGIGMKLPSWRSEFNSAPRYHWGLHEVLNPITSGTTAYVLQAANPAANARNQPAGYPSTPGANYFGYPRLPDAYYTFVPFTQPTVNTYRLNVNKYINGSEATTAQSIPNAVGEPVKTWGTYTTASNPVVAGPALARAFDDLPILNQTIMLLCKKTIHITPFNAHIVVKGPQGITA